MHILCIGDVVGSIGCNHLAARLPQLKKQSGIDVCIVNGENAADGNGITPPAAQHLFTYGADVITTGNHVWGKRDLIPLLEEESRVLRPANYPPAAPGSGYTVMDVDGWRLLCINVSGRVYLDPLSDPFDTVERILERMKEKASCWMENH